MPLPAAVQRRTWDSGLRVGLAARCHEVSSAVRQCSHGAARPKQRAPRVLPEECFFTVSLGSAPRPNQRSAAQWHGSNLVDPASSHMLVSKIKPCMSQYKLLYGETANGSLKQL